MLTPVLLSSHPEYVGAVRALYEESFPESERVPFEALIRSCTMDGRFYVFTEGKEVKAMAAMAVGKTIMSLVYFAVVPEARITGPALNSSAGCSQSVTAAASLSTPRIRSRALPRTTSVSAASGSIRETASPPAVLFPNGTAAAIRSGPRAA